MPTLEALQEVIAAPENPTPDIQAAMANPDVQMPSHEATADTQGYSYTRADGTVERAATAEEARKICPVLGAMSVEQANVMLELSAIGKEKLAEQVTKQPEPKRAEPTKVDKVIKPNESARKTMVSGTPERTLPKELSPIVTANVEAQLKEQLIKETVTDRYREAVLASVPIKAITSEPAADMLHAAEDSSTVQDMLLEGDRVWLENIVHRASESNIIVDNDLKNKSREPQLFVAGSTFMSEVGEITEPASEDSKTIEEVAALTSDTAEAMTTIVTSQENTEHTEEILTVVDWTAELDAEPLELCEDFTEALRSIAAALSIDPAANVETSIVMLANPQESIEAIDTQPLPSIAETVAERLTELAPEDKEITLPVLHDIASTIQEIQLLEVQEADPETVSVVEAQLEELVITLFEVIGIDYDEQDIEQFMRLILYPAFQPPQPTTQEVVIDLEHTGTREAKWHFPQLTSSLATVQQQLQQTLGTFALFYTSVALKSHAS